ncbi:hypothetical protein C1646_722199 [Rhizophagus diaphanus]|nr:hypothetical protein C1646_722199 [Rhizophagus diaphanus] [Rhizophagus sp. MUCL 43196]
MDNIYWMGYLYHFVLFNLINLHALPFKQIPSTHFSSKIIQHFLRYLHYFNFYYPLRKTHSIKSRFKIYFTYNFLFTYPNFIIFTISYIDFSLL